MEAIETRLRKLERTNRIYKKIFLLLIAGCAIVLTAFRNRNAVPDVLQAKSFEVVDDQGNVLVRVGQDAGFGLVKTFNKYGKKLVNITYTTKNEGFIGVENGNDRENIRLSSSGSGGGYIGVFNTSSQKVAILSDEEGGGYLGLCNNSGDIKALLKSQVDAGGFLAMYNSSGYSMASLLQTITGSGDLYIRNNNGDDRIRLSVSDAGGSVHVFNNSKTKVVDMGVTTAQNGIVNTYNSGGTNNNGAGGN
jgi:hypothetical protein